MLSTKTYTSIKEIPSSEWNAVIHENDYFKSHEFLKIMEESNVENSTFWYILVFKNDEIIGAGVFSSFIVSLDLFLDEQAKKGVGMMRKLFPDFLRIRFLFCGLPISVGKDTILIKEPGHSNDILEAILRESKLIAKAHNIKIINFKEFYLNEKIGLNHLLSFGFVKSWSSPDVDF